MTVTMRATTVTSTMRSAPCRLARHARWRTLPPSRVGARGGGSRRGVSVHTRALGDGRFRDDAERRAAIDRLSPPSTSRDDGPDADRATNPMPKITRTKDKTRPRRFKDALDDDRKRKGSMATGFSRYASTDDPNEESDRERVAREARERGRAKRIAAVETEAADRLSAMVQLMRAELGNPQMLLSIDGKIRDLRFARLYERLKNYGSVEIMFGLVKYYTERWDETESDRTVLYYGDEETKAELASNARRANAEREQNYREEQSSSSSSSDIPGDVVASVDEDGDVEVDQARLDDDVDEATRRALLRAAQLRATQRGDEVRSNSTDYSGDESFGDDSSRDGSDPDEEYGLMDAIADMVRSYFSVDMVKDEDGNEEMVVMTSPEFIGFLIVAVIVSSRLGRYLVDTFLASPIDPLLR